MQHRDNLAAWMRFEITHRRRKPAADVLGSPTKRISVQVCIPGRGGRLCMPKQLADDRKPEAKPCPDARMGVAKIVDAKVAQAGTFSDRAPRPVEVRARLVRIHAGGLAGDHVGTDAGQVAENVEGRGIQHDRFLSGFAVR